MFKMALYLLSNEQKSLVPREYAEFSQPTVRVSDNQESAG